MTKCFCKLNEQKKLKKTTELTTSTATQTLMKNINYESSFNYA